MNSMIQAVFSAALALASAAHADTLTDARILGIYVQVNGFDIETALLARAQATTSELRMLADHVAGDHVGVRQTALALANQCKSPVELPSDRTAAALEHGAALRTLLGLKGKDFDSTYLELEVKFHREAVDAVRTILLPAARCPALQRHLRDILPAFEHHLAETEALAKDLGAR